MSGSEGTHDPGAPARDDEQPRGPEQIRADIEETRDALGDTVEALAAKSDVKGQVQAKVVDAKANARAKFSHITDTAKAKVDEAKDRLPGAGGASEPGEPGATPAVDSARQAASKAASVVKERPTGFAIGAALVTGYVIGKARGRRS